MRSAILILTAMFVAAVAPAGAQRPGVGFRAPKMHKKGPRAGKQLDRIERMTPAERKRFLEGLPENRRREAERRFEQFDRMSAEQKGRVARGMEQLENMPVERRTQLRRLYREFNEIPAERRPVLRGELQSLRKLEPEARAERMNTDEFRNTYSAKEQKLLADLSKVLEPEEN